MDEKLTKGEKAYFGRKEKRNKKVYICLTIVLPFLNLVSLTLMLYNYLDKGYIYVISHYTNLITYCTCFALNLYFSTKLFFIMRKSHHYEYLRTYKSIVLHTWIFTIYFMLSILFELYEIIYDYNNSLDLTKLPTTCSTPQGVFSQWSWFLFDQIDIFGVMLCYVIVYIKRTDDIFTGVSKLDKLIKQSQFQVYKSKYYNRFSVFTSAMSASSRKIESSHQGST